MRVLIFANGIPDNPPQLPSLIDLADLVIAADGGANHCLKLGVRPDILLGDFDSIASTVLEDCESGGAEINRHPPRKDATDLELALDLAMERGGTHVWLLGVLGGRWDMSLANIMLAAGESYKNMRISLLSQDCKMVILHPGHDYALSGTPGETISLLPLQGDVHGVTLTGFEYPLTDHTIRFGSSLGVSNVLQSSQASICHSEGVLLCIRQFQL